VSEAVQRLGGLDIVVCNAGRQQSNPSILDISTDDFDATMKTNIYAPFWIIKAALPHLKPGSAIIGTTSEQAYDPSADLYDYAQTKAATMNYVKSPPSSLHPRASASTALRRVRSGRRSRSAAAHRSKSTKNLAARPCSGGPASPPSSPPFTFSLLLKMPALPPATSTAPAADRVNRNALLGIGAAVHVSCKN
jgi:hypothetical protein